MSERSSLPLTFRDLDGVTFAAGRGKLDAFAGRSFHMADLGPWLEMARLEAAGGFTGAPAGLFRSQPRTRSMEAALRADSTTTESAPIASTYVVRPSGPVLSIEGLAGLGIAAGKTATVARIAKQTILRIGSALYEVFDNVFEHSGAYQTGFAAFRALPGSFEFVVADQGEGVLASLRRSSRYADLSDHGEALQRALQPDVSRYDEPGHGHGFDRLVEGMANLNSELRFRTGDAVVQMSGLGGARPKPTLARRPLVSGFVVSAKFHAT